MAHVRVDPAELVFHVKASSPETPGDVAIPIVPCDNEGGERTLTITNRHGIDCIVFAVRTNAPMQFVVRNGEGMLTPRATAVVRIHLRRSARRSKIALQCRFLVQYGLHIPLPESSNSSHSTGASEPEERLQRSCLRLGKEWRGRNMDLYDSGSVVVPCRLVASLLTRKSKRQTVLAGLMADVARKEAVYNALIAKRDALTSLVQQAADANAKTREALAREARQRSLPTPIETVALLLFLSATVLVATQLAETL